MDNSGANNIKVLNDSWYSVCNRFMVGKDNVEVSRMRSFMTDE